MLPTHIFGSDPVVIEFAEAVEPEVEKQIADLRSGPGVFAVWPAAGEPYLGRAGDLRRRLSRLLRTPQQPARRLNLRGMASRVEYWPTASRLESWLILYDLART